MSGVKVRDLIQHYFENDILILDVLPEKMELFDTPQIARNCENVVRQSHANVIIVDLSRVYSVDSAGMGFLINMGVCLAKKAVCCVAAAPN